MHELAIVTGMMEKIEKVKVEQSWKDISRVQMVVGVLSGVERHSIEACFELLTSEWRIKPELDFIIDPIEYTCLDCGKISLLEIPNFICSHCQSVNGQTKGGRSLYFSEMEGE